MSSILRRAVLAILLTLAVVSVTHQAHATTQPVVSYITISYDPGWDENLRQANGSIGMHWQILQWQIQIYQFDPGTSTWYLAGQTSAPSISISLANYEDAPFGASNAQGISQITYRSVTGGLIPGRTTMVLAYPYCDSGSRISAGNTGLFLGSFTMPNTTYTIGTSIHGIFASSSYWQAEFSGCGYDTGAWNLRPVLLQQVWNDGTLSTKLWQ